MLFGGTEGIPGDLAADLLARAAGLAQGLPRPVPRTDDGRARLSRRLDACESRARRLADGLEQGAALDFLGEAVAAVAVEELWSPGEARAMVTLAAEDLGLTEEAATFAVFRRALASTEVAQLPPAVAADLIVSLLVELAPAAAASLWVADAGSTRCVAAAGAGPRSRRLKDAARATLDGVDPSSPCIHTLPVERWDRPHAALVVRSCATHADGVEAFLAEAADALSPVLEREALYDRGAAQERALVSAGERRLARLGCDLHDGPLQELVAFAEDIRHARSQVTSIVEAGDAARVGGRFEDLEARLESLDRGLREIVRSASSTTAVERPLESALRHELDALTRGGSGIEAKLSIGGDVKDLTDSQKIVVFRVVQEALSNVRKHSGASHVAVTVRSTRSVIEVSVADDGRGFDPAVAAASGRLGLAGVAERVRLLGGVVEIQGRVGEGTKVRATLPHWRPTREQTAAVYAVSS